MINKISFLFVSTIFITDWASCMDQEPMFNKKIALPVELRKACKHGLISANDAQQHLTNIKKRQTGDRQETPIDLPYTVLTGHTSLLNTVVSFKTQSGRTLLASGGYDKKILIWDLDDSSFPCIKVLDAQGIVWAMNFTENDNGLYLFWGSEVSQQENYVYAKHLIFESSDLDQAEDDEIKQFGPYENFVSNMVVMQPNFIVWSIKNKICTLNISENKYTEEKVTDDNRRVQYLCKLDENHIAEQIMTPSKQFLVQIHDLSSNTIDHLIDYENLYLSICPINQNELMIVSGYGYKYDVWDWEKKKIIREFVNTAGGIACTYSNESFITWTPQIYVLNDSDGATIQTFTSKVLSDPIVFQNTMCVTDKYIIYTVGDSWKNIYENNIYVSKRPN